MNRQYTVYVHELHNTKRKQTLCFCLSFLWLYGCRKHLYKRVITLGKHNILLFVIVFVYVLLLLIFCMILVSAQFH